jgi:serine/threonine protein kinase
METSPGVSASGGHALWEGKDWGPPEIIADELEYQEKIGGGCFGSVYRGRCRGKEVAIKKLFRQDVDEKTLNEFKKEVHVMSQLRHPNVLLFMGACTTPGKMALVTEILPKGNLASFLHDTAVEVSLFKRICMARDTALGMNWLHCSNPVIIHRDLKPCNLLLDEHLTVKVCDFGLSALKQPGDKLQDKGGIPGTPLWMAPEVLLGKPLDEKSDVYSFGIVLWEIITRKEPFDHMDSFKAFKRAVCRDDERPPVPKNIPASLADLMQRCWNKEPTARPSFAEIISQLDSVLVDIAIKEEPGNKYWKKHFLSKTKILWSAFSPILLKDLGASVPPDDVRVKCLHALLVEKQQESGTKMREEHVTLDGFGRLLAWFGPYELALFDRLKTILLQPWFHGHIESGDAESKLSTQPKGSYLVRLSSVPGCFTISKVGKNGQISHQRIDFNPAKGFSVIKQTSDGATREATTPGLNLEAFLSSHAAELFLLTPIECTTWKHLFVTSSVEGYLNVATDDY